MQVDDPESQPRDHQDGSAQEISTSRPLRFLMITTFYPPYHFGGDGNYVRQLAHILVGMGHTVDIVHDIDAYRLLSDNPEPAAIVEPDGITVHGLETRIPALSCLATQQLGTPVVNRRRIQRIIDQGNFDVIHYHNISLVGGPGILAMGSGAVKLYTAHEHWLVCPTHILWRYNREVCDKRECIRCVLSFKRPPQLWRYTGLLKRKIQHVDAFCSPSEFSANKHKEYGFPRDMRVIPSFLRDKTATPEPSDIIPTAVHHRPFFLYVGRLEIIKGVQDIIPAFLDSPPADLLIVGAGNYEQELRALAGDSQHIHFLGWKPPEEIKILYSQATAVLMPSVCYEVFPLVVLEAFKERTPIIARDLGPYPEVVRKSQGGLLFETQEQLRAAIDQLATNTQQRNQMGAAGLHAYNSYWCENTAMQVYFGLIREVARNKGFTALEQVIQLPSDSGRVAS